MPVETFNYIDSLNTANPTSTDNVSEGDDHIRGLKTTLKNTFPNISDAVTATHTELNYVDGVTSNIQTQIDNIDPLPSQTGHSGEYLTTDGSAASWVAIETGNSAVVGWENQVTVAENYTITTNYNMMSAGPITIDSGYSVTVPSGSVWTIV